MQVECLELSIGDAVQIGDHILTVIDIDDNEIRFDLFEGGFDQTDLDESRGELPRW